MDLTRIDEMLRLEPIERLRMNDRAINAVLELRDAFAAKPWPHGHRARAGDGGVELILVGGLAVHSRSEAALARAQR